MWEKLFALFSRSCTFFTDMKLTRWKATTTDLGEPGIFNTESSRKGICVSVLSNVCMSVHIQILRQKVQILKILDLFQSFVVAIRRASFTSI
jgi:hypothetical protein